MRTLRFYSAQPLKAGQVSLSGDKGHHLSTVLRVRRGQRVHVFNGQDGEWQGEVLEAAPRRAVLLELHTQVRPGGVCQGPELGFGILKPRAMGLLVRMATELGVGRLQPLITRRSGRTFAPERYEVIAVEAAEQCERLDVPTLLEPAPLESWLERWHGGSIAWACERTGRAAESLRGQGLLLGPEGGWSDEEKTVLQAHPAVEAVSLGPWVLRAETAAVAALALWRGTACGA